MKQPSYRSIGFSERFVPHLNLEIGRGTVRAGLHSSDDFVDSLQQALLMSVELDISLFKEILVTATLTWVWSPKKISIV